jgi:inner membrane protein
MASIGHIAVGMTAARLGSTSGAPRWTAMAWWSLLALLPDVDVVGFVLGVPYRAPWGHRGATHSLVFALAVAALVACAASTRRLRPLRTWVIATIALASHGPLDTLTDGGLGCALLWPFDDTRFFAPWRPIPVAPIGMDLLSMYGALVAATELVLFTPLVAFAVRSRLSMTLLPVWAAAAWLLVSGDPARDAVVAFVLRDRTQYAHGFSEDAFRSIRVGQASGDVRRTVGGPLGEWWDYLDDERPAVGHRAGCPWIYLESDRVTMSEETPPPVAAVCSENGVRPGMSREELEAQLGRPQNVCWRYTKGEGFHRARVVCFAGGRVVTVLRRWRL